MTMLPKYKRKERQILAWLFMSSVKIQLTKTNVTLILEHLNLDFLHRFNQLIRLGYYTDNPFKRGIPYWELSNLDEISFLMQQILPFIRARRRKKLAKLLIEFCNNPNAELEEKIRKLNQPPHPTYELW